MSLVVPQEVQLQWNAKIKQRYIGLGYMFTHIGDKFLCNIDDLSTGSSAMVKVKCDMCGEISKIQYRYLLRHTTDTYYCEECKPSKKNRKYRDLESDNIYIPYRDKSWLFNEYITKQRLSKDIASDCGISDRTLREWIGVFGLNNKMVKRYTIDKDTLFDLYVTQHKTTLEIGELFNLSEGTILDLLYEYNIPIPDRSELMHRYYYEKGGIERARKYAQSMENRIKVSCRDRGIDVDEFDGFSTTESHMVRNSSQYVEWRTNVFNRDNYTCQKCGKRGGDLEAHHLYPFAEFPEKRFLVDNGVTLCCECHSPEYSNSFHSIYGVHNNTPEQYYEFLKLCDISASITYLF